ncbi:succinate dehydrogenase [ubiquinone] cytochrome b small subunit A, mitochondrial-like [Lineus longissimus]|uniref:succinate dehydrogenase [ubiquinone] cytochrome b small subunit A, mitochondrial-like n=1 Tax=Lineus longissimus TaxID=88925 RepID=UPI002B4EE2EB
MATFSVLRLSSRGVQQLLASRLVKPAWAATTAAHKQLTIVPAAQMATKSRYSEPVEWGAPEKHHLLPSKHWAIERYLATGLIFVIPAAFLYPNPVLEYLMTAGVVLHAHWGLDTVSIDYVHRKVLPPKVCETLVLSMGIVAFACLCYFNYNDVGFTGACKLLWTLDK